MILSAWLPSLLEAITVSHAWDHPKSWVCVCVFFLPPSGWRVFRLWSSCTCSQMHAEPTALRRILFQVPNVGVWWFIWCQVDSCGDNTCSSASAKDASWCNGKLFYLRIKLKTRDSLFTFIITHPVKTCWKEMGFARRLNSSELSLLSSQHFWVQFFFNVGQLHEG